MEKGIYIEKNRKYEMNALGIDLGTTNSLIAYYNPNTKLPDIVISAEGERKVPSFVSFKDKERVVGNVAKDELIFELKNNSNGIEYANTIYEMKRLIGRRIDDEEIKNDLLKWPFEVTADNDTKRPLAHANYKGIDYAFRPEQISAFILNKLKRDASDILKKDVRDVVITVPAYFNNAQRKATKDAGAIALLNVVGMINEPTAAAIAYGIKNQTDNEKYVLVFDLGGGTFDLSLLSIKKDYFEVIATKGNTHLGGGDFDKLFYDSIFSQLEEEKQEIIQNNPRLRIGLMNECIKAKEVLSTKTVAIIHVEFDPTNGKYDTFEVSREEFNEICEEKFESTLNYIDDILKDAKLTREDIEEVLLVGGSTRIPRIQDLLKEYFGEEKIYKSENQDEVVALGAALYAAKLSGQLENTEYNFEFKDITPLSLGIQVKGDIMSTVVKRNTPIPLEISNVFVTSEEYQKNARFPVYEGENNTASLNHYLGEFKLENILSKEAGKDKFDVIFKINENGILNVKAIEKETGKENEITIKDSGLLSDEEIEELRKQSEMFNKEEEMANDIVSSKTDLKKCVRDAKKLAEKKEKIKDNGNDVNFLILKKKVTEAEKILKDKSEINQTEILNKLKIINSDIMDLMDLLK